MDGEDADIKSDPPPAEKAPGDDSMADEPTKDADAMAGEPTDGDANEGEQNKPNDIIGSAAIRPVFLGNLNHDCKADDVAQMFETPVIGGAEPVPVDRVDLKRGFCFVFLKDAESQDAKERAEKYVSDINGMNVDKVSNALRSEFARGDGRIKRKEDDRRKKIQPSETLFVVNFHEETTKREDLQMLFEPYGELVRIDMKRNYAFVQFTTTDDAKRAKEATNGGKLDQSIITVEYVARRMGEGGERRRDRDRDRGGYRGDRRGPPPGYGRGPDRRRYDRYDDYRDSRGGGYRGRDDRYDDRGRGGYRSRSRSPGYRRGRSRSRSRSPPGYRHRSRSPSPGGSGRRHRDDYRGGGRSGGYDDRDGSRGRGRGDDYSRGDRDRGYRSGDGGR